MYSVSIHPDGRVHCPDGNPSGDPAQVPQLDPLYCVLQQSLHQAPLAGNHPCVPRYPALHRHNTAGVRSCHQARSCCWGQQEETMMLSKV